MRIALASIIVASLLLGGCTASEVRTSPSSMHVQVGSSSPGAGYVQIGPITAIHGGGCGLYGSEGNYEGAMTILRNKAAAMGADYVQILSQEGEHMTGMCLDRAYTISGYAFKRMGNVAGTATLQSAQSLPRSYYNRVKLIREKLLEGDIPASIAFVTQQTPSESQALTAADASTLEKYETWWLSSSGSERWFIYIANLTSSNLSVIEFSVNSGSCSNPTSPVSKINIQLAHSIASGAKAVINFPDPFSHGVAVNIHCGIITGAWRPSN